MADVETAIAVEAAAVAAVCEAESVQVGAMVVTELLEGVQLARVER